MASKTLLPSVVLVVPAFVFACASPAQDSEVLWRIGVCDGAVDEFALAPHYSGFSAAFPDGVDFEVGRDDPSTGWPWIHPGSSDAWAGSREHVFRIRFRLDRVPAGSAQLRVAYVATHPQHPPRAGVAVNGSYGSFALPGGNADLPDGGPVPHAPHVLSLPFAASLLRAGDNELVLRSVAGSWALYDCVELAVLPAGAAPPLPDLHVRPTPLLVGRDDALEQVLLVSLAEQAMLPADGTLELAIGDRLVQHPARAAGLGAWSAEIAVPAVDTTTEAVCRLVVGDAVREAPFVLAPARRWTIFVAPSSHVDIGYTHLQPECAAIHSDNYDAALDMCARFPGDFKWNTEAAWALIDYERTRSPERVELLVNLMRGECVGVGAIFANLLTGLASGEELCRMLYLAQRWRRDYGVTVPSAILTDAPSHVWTLPDVLCHAGIRYLSMGVNQTRAPKLLYGRLDALPYWWEGTGGPASRVLVMQNDGYSGARRLGLFDDVEVLRERVIALVERNAATGYPFDALHLHGAVSDNQKPDDRMALRLAEWKARYAWPRIVLSRNEEFFEYIEAHYGDRLPVVRGCEGSWWEDGAASSARETAINRANQRAVSAVEALWAILAARDPALDYPDTRLAECWRNIMLYDEHTWGAHNSISEPDLPFVREQFDIKAAYAVDAATALAGLQREGLDRLGAAVDTGGPALLVFNAHGRPFDGVVELPWSDPDISVPGAQHHGEMLAVEVEDIPAFGYRAIPLVRREQRPHEPAESRTGVLENRFYRIRLSPDTGAVASLFDKEAGRELVDGASPWRINQFLYCSGGEESAALHHGNPNPPQFLLSSMTRPRIASGPSGPVYRSTVVEGSGPTFERIRCEVRLFENEKRIDFINTLERAEEVRAKEAVFFAFPFAAAQPSITYSIGGGAVVAGQDWTPGACKDWFAVQDWVRVSDGAADARAAFDIVWSPRDTPLIQLNEIQTGKWLRELPIANGTVLAYAMNNYWFTNYKAGQSGRFVFRYSLTSGRGIDRAAAEAFGSRVNATPLAAVVAVGDGPLPREGSFLEVRPSGVVVQALKRAEDGTGLILRCRNLSETERDARVSFGLLTVSAVQPCDGLEEPADASREIAGRAVDVPMPPYGLATLRLIR